MAITCLSDFVHLVNIFAIIFFFGLCDALLQALLMFDTAFDPIIAHSPRETLVFQE